MPNLSPEGYSGSSERLSNASTSSRGVVSTTFSLSCWELCLEEARESDFSFSTWLRDVCLLEGMPGGAGVLSSMLRSAVGLVRERVGDFMARGRGKRGGWKG